MKILITICARGGSKGIPGKNYKLINNRPLIEYTIESAKEFAKIVDSKISISTDDSNIVQICKKNGVYNNYLRPEALATDTAGKIDTIFDLLKFEEEKSKCEYEYILDLDVTSPLRTLDDLLKSFEMISTNHNALNLFSVNKAKKNPYFNMVEEINENGFYELCKKGAFLTRQSAPKVFELNASFYFYKRKFFEMKNKSVINEKSLVYIMNHICFDLDEILDFEFMNYLIQNNKLDFKF